MRITNKLRLEAESVLEVLTYLDEKMLGLRYRLFNDSAGNKRRVLTIYLEGVSEGMCEQVIFPGCVRVAEGRIGLTCNFGLRHRRVQAATGRIKVRISQVLSRSVFFHTPARFVEIPDLRSQLEDLATQRHQVITPWRATG